MRKYRSTATVALQLLFAGLLVVVFSQQPASATNLSFGSGTFAGPWSLDAANNTFTTTGSLASPSILNGVISESFTPANLLLTGNSGSNAVQIANLNANSTYTGNTTMRSGGARMGFRIGVDNALPTGTVLTLEGNNTGTGRPVWFDLNGHSQELAGISHAVRTDSAIVNGDAANNGVLIINNNSAVTYQAFLGPDNAHTNITSSVDTGIPNGEGNNFSLTKNGAGTLTLTRDNSYTGDTIINDGTLSINFAYLFDMADVYINGDGTFDLGFVGTDIIDELFLDGAPQPIGTYGAIGSGAEYESNFFTGTGQLSVSSVVPEPTPVAMWIVLGLGLAGFGYYRVRRKN